MRGILRSLALAILVPCLGFAAQKKHELTMSLDDRFVVSESEQWNVKVERILPLRLADVRITPKTGSAFDLTLYFKCDTPDLAQFDSPEKIEKSVRKSCEKYLPHIVEKHIEIKKLNVKGWYGCYTVFTDKDLAAAGTVPEGQFKFMTRGMIRLSPDSALGFSLMTNAVDTPTYKELLDYVYSFVKDKAVRRKP